MSHIPTPMSTVMPGPTSGAHPSSHGAGFSPHVDTAGGRHVESGVAFYRCDDGAGPSGHDDHTKLAVSRQVADLLDRPFAGVFNRSRRPDAGLYLVPSETLSDITELNSLGIHDTTSFLGGAVPWAFVATKVISHPTVAMSADHPAGWNPRMAAMLKGSVLPGYSVFSKVDAKIAGQSLLADGAVRIKSAAGVGGSGQSVVRSFAALEAQLAAMNDDTLTQHGWVLERNLDQVSTFSVGQIQIASWLASYVGTQFNTTSHLGNQVYGGSVLEVVRGDLDVLLASSLTTQERKAVDLAIRYHDAVRVAYPDMFASRINYDVAQGTDGQGHTLWGVLEQSWRIGGASGAELAALHAFKADPGLQRVRTAIREVYHDGNLALPIGCTVLYDDHDPVAGRLTKYVQVVANGSL